MERKDLTAGRGYRCSRTGMFFFTPDGAGGFWYETVRELREQHGGDVKIIQVSEIKDY